MAEGPGRAAGRGGIILVYHRIAGAGPDPHALSVSPERFAEHVEVLSSHWAPISLETMSGFPRGEPVPSNAVAITFDDGYADNLTHAKPALESHSVPGAFFAALDYLENPREFWWDELERCLLESSTLPETLHVGIGGREYRWELGNAQAPPDRDDAAYWGWKAWVKPPPTARHQTYRDLHAALRPLPPEAQDEVLAELRSQCGVTSAPPREAYRPLTLQELKQLDAGPLTEVGAHSSTHAVLANLSQEAQRAEIEGCKERMEAILGRRVRLFAYPYGGRRDYTGQTVQIVQQAGFYAACAGFPGRLTRRTDPFQLPRFLVFNWNGEEFQRQLEKFFGGRAGRILRRNWG